MSVLPTPLCNRQSSAVTSGNPQRQRRPRQPGNNRSFSLEAKHPLLCSLDNNFFLPPASYSCNENGITSPGFANFFHTKPLLCLPVQLQQAYSRSYKTCSNNQTGNVKVILFVQPATLPSGSNIKVSHVFPPNPISPGLNVPSWSPSHCLPHSHPKWSSTPTTMMASSGVLSSCLTVDSRRNRITVTDPTPPPTLRRRTAGQLVSKSFTFDAVLTQSHRPNMAELCETALTDAMLAVLQGQDGCLLTIGHRNTGKTRSMLGSTEFQDTLGLIPCGINWLFSLLSMDKEKNGIRFSVRVSAVELFGHDETLRDLFADLSTSNDNSNDESRSPSHYLQINATPRHSVGNASRPPDDSLCQEADSVAQRVLRLQSKQCELRAGSAERAAHLLDVAIRRRSPHESGLSHMLFTLHIYRCRLEASESGTNVNGGRARLHFFDLGCGRYGHQRAAANKSHPCRPKSQSTDADVSRFPNREGDTNYVRQCATSRCLSLSGIGNVLLALLTGQRHLPFRDSALTYLLREAVTGTQMLQPCILAHVSAAAQHYTETLQVVQLASKLSRLRRRRVGGNLGITLTPQDSLSIASSEETGSLYNTDSSSSAAASANRYPHRRGPRLGRLSYGSCGRPPSARSCSSDFDFSSSSGEQSCDTVIFAENWRGNTSGNLPVSMPSELRGTADGSVDHCDVGRHGGSSVEHLPTSKMDLVQERNEPRRISSRGNNSAGGVKRMVPRTNVMVWPRSRALRHARYLIDSHEETWIDGPNAMILPPDDNTTRSMETSTTQPLNSETSSHNQYALSTTPRSPPYRGHSHSPLAHQENLGNSCLPTCQKNGNPCSLTATADAQSFEDDRRMESLGDAIRLPTISRQNSAPSALVACPSSVPSFPMVGMSETMQLITQVPQEEGTNDSGGTNSSSSCSSTLENQCHRGNRALSDISERTEETGEMTAGEKGSTDQWPSLGRTSLLSNAIPPAMERSMRPSSAGNYGDIAAVVASSREPAVGETQKASHLVSHCQKELSTLPRQQFECSVNLPSLSQFLRYRKTQDYQGENTQTQLSACQQKSIDCSALSAGIVNYRPTTTFSCLQNMSANHQEPLKGYLTTFNKYQSSSQFGGGMHTTSAALPNSYIGANKTPYDITIDKIQRSVHQPQVGARQQLPVNKHGYVDKTNHHTRSQPASPQATGSMKNSTELNGHPVGSCNSWMRVAAWVNSIHHPNSGGTSQFTPVPRHQNTSLRVPRKQSTGECVSDHRTANFEQGGSLEHTCTSSSKADITTVNGLLSDEAFATEHELSGTIQAYRNGNQTTPVSFHPAISPRALKSLHVQQNENGSRRLDPNKCLSSIPVRMRSVSADPFSGKSGVYPPNPLKANHLPTFNNDSGLHSPVSLSCSISGRCETEFKYLTENGYNQQPALSLPVSPSRPYPVRIEVLQSGGENYSDSLVPEWSVDFRSNLQCPISSQDANQTDTTALEDPKLHVYVPADSGLRAKPKTSSKGRKFLTLPLFRSLRIKSRGNKKQPKKLKSAVQADSDTTEGSENNGSPDAPFHNALPYKSPLCRMEKLPQFIHRTIDIGEIAAPSVLSTHSKLSGCNIQNRMDGMAVVPNLSCIKPDISGRIVPYPESGTLEEISGSFQHHGQEFQQFSPCREQMVQVNQRMMGAASGNCCYPNFCNEINGVCGLRNGETCGQVFQNAALPVMDSFSSTPLAAVLTSSTTAYQHHRNGRRSVTGGPASSGYESMRIGTSDISLSHSSPSECSASSGRWPDQSLRGNSEATRRNSCRGNLSYQKSGKGDKYHRHPVNKSNQTGKHRSDSHELLPVSSPIR